MDACSGVEAFCRGEKDGLLSVKKNRFIWGRYINISEGIRNMKEYESASCYGCYMTSCPWLRFRRKSKGYGREEPEAKSVRMVNFATESVMGRVRKR